MHSHAHAHALCMHIRPSQVLVVGGSKIACTARAYLLTYLLTCLLTYLQVLVVGGSKIACTARALRVNAIVTKATERWPGDAAVSEVADRMCVEVLALHIKAAMELRQVSK